jgi:hypothetical protein
MPSFSMTFGILPLIDVNESQVKVNYTINMPPPNMSEEIVGVLPFVHKWLKERGEQLGEVYLN